jgi:glycosyltransferase involved in cell wall biosynthesis
MTDELVSVIIPNYCHSDYLEQRLTSVLNQTYQNIEVIILDDASDDDGASQRIIEQYRSHPKVSNIIYNAVNCGSPFRQWKKGLSLARGKWIWIAESDDYCELRFLQTCLDFISDQDSISFVYCQSRLVNAVGNLLGYAPSTHSGLYDGATFINKFMTAGSSVWNASAVLFKRTNAIKCIDEILNFKAAGDYFFWCLLAEKGDVGVIDEPLNFFRQHDGKVTPKRSIDGTEDYEVLQILHYLDSKHYLKGVTRFRSMRHFYHRLFGWGYTSEALRTQLLQEYAEIATLPVLFYRLDFFVYRLFRYLRKVFGS